MFYEPDCEACGDLGWIDGRRCACFERRRAADKLARLNRRYARFAEHDLATLAPRPDLHPRQAQLVPMIQADPGVSLVMFGGTGTGKTLIGYCLAKRAITEGRPVYAITLAELLKQYRDQARNAEAPVTVDAELIRESPARPLVFLDEIDKARPSEFAGEMLFQLANAIYDTNAQVIVCANLPKSDLIAHWDRAGDADGERSQYGAPILRRFLDVEGAWEVNFFEE